MKIKAMISQPMAGLTDEQILATKAKAVKYLEEQGYEVINTFFDTEWFSKEALETRGVKQVSVCFLAKSLDSMSLCDTVYFAKGWESARGCWLEHEVAVRYGLSVLYEFNVQQDKK